MFCKIKELLNISEDNVQNDTELEKSVKDMSIYFCLKLNTKWKECNRTRIRFEKRHAAWLNDTFSISEHLMKKLRSKQVGTVNHSGKSKGRPKKQFEDLSLKTKRRRVEDVVSKMTTEELSFAAQRSAEVSTSISQPVIKKTSLSPQQALGLYLDLDLSVRKYNILRSVVNSIHKDCFPSLGLLTEQKKQYLPTNVKVNDFSAEVDIQELLQKTTYSILKLCNIVNHNLNLKLICKWGMDGSAGHSLYKQKFSENLKTDEYMFLVALVPLKLVDEETGDNLWINLRPSSTLFCRPVKFAFIKETAELVREEERQINTKINNLKPYKTSFNNWCLEIKFKMCFTMLDGSVGNILSGTNATSRCFICGASPKEMNSEAVLNKTFPRENLRFGLSTLHCWIRFFECLLHIAYRLPIKSWQVKGENKQIVENNKKRIQSEFRSKMALLVDKPKPGFGSTNDGNTARRFFKNPKLSAEITNIDQQLIIKFSIILRVLSSGYKINLDKFRQLLTETRELYINLYSWFYMPSSIHKVLVHGAMVIEFFDLPIGQLSEEALEARHKEIKKLRLNHTRKTSRINTNTDLFNLLLLTSDPELSTQRKIISKKNSQIDDKIKPYLIVEDHSDDSSDLSLHIDFSILSESDEENNE